MSKCIIKKLETAHSLIHQYAPFPSLLPLLPLLLLLLLPLVFPFPLTLLLSLVSTDSIFIIALAWRLPCACLLLRTAFLSGTAVIYLLEGIPSPLSPSSPSPPPCFPSLSVPTHSLYQLKAFSLALIAYGLLYCAQPSPLRTAFFFASFLLRSLHLHARNVITHDLFCLQVCCPALPPLSFPLFSCLLNSFYCSLLLHMVYPLAHGLLHSRSLCERHTPFYTAYSLAV